MYGYNGGVGVDPIVGITPDPQTVPVSATYQISKPRVGAKSRENYYNRVLKTINGEPIFGKTRNNTGEHNGRRKNKTTVSPYKDGVKTFGISDYDTTTRTGSSINMAAHTAGLAKRNFKAFTPLPINKVLAVSLPPNRSPRIQR